MPQQTAVMSVCGFTSGLKLAGLAKRRLMELRSFIQTGLVTVISPHFSSRPSMQHGQCRSDNLVKMEWYNELL